MISIVCKNCEKTFHRKQYGSKFCSRACYVENRKTPENRLYKEDKNGCWNFQLGKDKDGYGLLNINGKQIRAHRYFFEKYNGKIYYGNVIDHLCKNKSCVNPDHLEQVTPYENYIRGNNAKLKVKDIFHIREIGENKSQKEIAKMFNVSVAQVSRIINNKTWKTITL